MPKRRDKILPNVKRRALVIDSDLHQLVKLASAISGHSIGAWMDEAVKEKLGPETYKTLSHLIKEEQA